jgi:hypothetical protein
MAGGRWVAGVRRGVRWVEFSVGTTGKVGPTYFSKLTFRGVRTLFLDVCSDVAKQRWRSAFQRSRYVVVTHRRPTQKSGSQTQPKHRCLRTTGWKLVFAAMLSMSLSRRGMRLR